jgi:hypothetical protein
MRGRKHTDAIAGGSHALVVEMYSNQAAIPDYRNATFVRAYLEGHA